MVVCLWTWVFDFQDLRPKTQDLFFVILLPISLGQSRANYLTFCRPPDRVGCALATRFMEFL
jgi:hypothetical protein